MIKILNWEVAWNEPVKKYFNIIVLLTNTIWDIDEKIETFLEMSFLIFLLVHYGLEISKEWLDKDSVLLVVFRKNWSEDSGKL